MTKVVRSGMIEVGSTASGYSDPAASADKWDREPPEFYRNSIAWFEPVRNNLVFIEKHLGFCHERDAGSEGFRIAPKCPDPCIEGKMDIIGSYPDSAPDHDFHDCCFSHFSVDFSALFIFIYTVFGLYIYL